MIKRTQTISTTILITDQIIPTTKVLQVTINTLIMTIYIINQSLKIGQMRLIIIKMIHIIPDKIFNMINLFMTNWKKKRIKIKIMMKLQEKEVIIGIIRKMIKIIVDKIEIILDLEITTVRNMKKGLKTKNLMIN